MRRALGILLLIIPFATHAADSARAKGMTIFGDQEMPHVRTDMPWREIDVDALQHESLHDIIDTVIKKSYQLSRQQMTNSLPDHAGRADFKGLIQAYRMKLKTTGSE